MRVLKILLLCMALMMLCFGCAPEVSDVPENEDVETEDVPGGAEEDVPDVDHSSWETADVAVANMGVGWNLGNTLDCHGASGERGDDWLYWETYWGQYKTSPELMTMMKKAGFGAVRVPVTWGIHMDTEGRVFESWMNRVHEVVDYVIDAGMYCIVNVHHDTGAGDGVWLLAGMDEYEKVCDRYSSLWTQIAEEFKDYDHRLLFESYNEMLDTRRSWCYASFNDGYDAAFAADAYEAINSYARTFVDAVRATGGNNVARNLIVNTYGACSGAGNWSSYLKDPLKEMVLPDDLIKDHLIFEVHAYPDIDDMDAMRIEVDDMFDALQVHLASKGAPVILGEWGTSSTTPVSADMIEFIDYFVSKAKEYDMGTLFWMGLSDGVSRSFPCFSQPDYASAILKAYHGDEYEPFLPVVDDFDCTYSVNYTSQWGELHLNDSSVSLDEYTGIYLRLASVPASGSLAVKVYGENDKVQYFHFTSDVVEIDFDRNQIGDVATRITLQYMQSGTYAIDVKRAALIKEDGTYVTTALSPFWGCDMKLAFEPL